MVHYRLHGDGRSKRGSGTLKWKFEALIFATGAVILSLEVLASRIMTPYFGVSLYIWSGILSITLTFLAIGIIITAAVCPAPARQPGPGTPIPGGPHCFGGLYRRIDRHLSDSLSTIVPGRFDCRQFSWRIMTPYFGVSLYIWRDSVDHSYIPCHRVSLRRPFVPPARQPGPGTPIPGGPHCFGGLYRRIDRHLSDSLSTIVPGRFDCRQFSWRNPAPCLRLSRYRQ